MGLVEKVLEGRVVGPGGRLAEKRFSLEDWAASFMWNGFAYPVLGGSVSSDVEEAENSFAGYVQGAYKSDGVVFACMLARQLVFSEARFQWQRMAAGRPGDLFGTPELSVLETPWPNGTTGELLSRMIQDADLAGNCYIAREGRRLRRLRPDWVSIVLSEPPDQAVESDVVGYLYTPGGPAGDRTQGKLYLPEEVAHWSPIPDPEAQYRGMSWLTPVIREVQGDKAATEHKLAFFRNGATLSTIVSLDPSIKKDEFQKFVAAMNEGHQGAANAYKTVYVGGGADVHVVGADLKQLDFKATQGAGETRVAAAARVHPVIVGLSEGLQGSSLNAGNFNSAKRGFADGTLRPLWRSASASLASLLRAPSGARLWYDARDVAFLREDQKDAAEIQNKQAQTIRTLVDAGYAPDSAIRAVMAEDWSLLEHSGLYSVQLQPPGAIEPPAPEPAAIGAGDQPAEGGELEGQ